MAGDNDRFLAAFVDHLAVERGLSPNTLAAYRRDLSQADAWIVQQCGHGLSEADATELVGVLRDLREAGMSSSTVARKLSVLLHRLWVTGEQYEPLYNEKQSNAVLSVA